MAKKKTNRKKRKKLEPLISVDDGYSVEFRFARRLENEPDLLRRLAHRAVDLLMDAGHHEWLSGTVAMDLSRLADELVVNHMTELIHDVRAEVKEAARG